MAYFIKKLLCSMGFVGNVTDSWQGNGMRSNQVSCFQKASRQTDATRLVDVRDTFNFEILIKGLESILS